MKSLLRTILEENSLNIILILGMRKEWILTEEEKRLKRRKIERNRLIKQQTQLGIRHSSQSTGDLLHSTFQSTHEVRQYEYRCI